MKCYFENGSVIKGKQIVFSRNNNIAVLSLILTLREFDVIIYDLKTPRVLYFPKHLDK